MPPGNHATLGASKAHRWMTCPGSIRLEKEAPPRGEPSVHALEGTAAHDMAEVGLTNGQDAAKVAQDAHEEGFREDWTQEMATAVQVFLDYVRSRLTEDSQLFIEQRVSLEALDPPAPMYGTADAVVWDEETRTLEVIDYKHGQGVVVWAEDNPQLKYYALGTILELRVKPERIVTTIVQPRAHRPEPIDSAEYTWDEIVAFKEKLLAAAEAASADDAPVGPVGDHCRWCPAKAICPAQRENALVVAQDEFDVTAVETGTPPAPETLSLAQLTEVLEKSPIVEDWIKEVRAYAQAALERGEEVPGWKLVEGRRSRSWADEQEAEEWLRQRYKVGEVFTKKLISPYQAEKLVKGRPRLEIPEDMIAVSSGKPKLAPESSAKPAITAGTEFPLLEEPNE